MENQPEILTLNDGEKQEKDADGKQDNGPHLLAGHLLALRRRGLGGRPPAPGTPGAGGDL